MVKLASLSSLQTLYEIGHITDHIVLGTKKYEVIKSIWPYADVARGTPGRRVAVQDEEEWFLDWKDSIRHAVLGKRSGWVTAEDKLEFLMEPMDSEESTRGWAAAR